MSLPVGRLALRLERDRRLLVDVADVYYLEADRDDTLVRLRGARPLRDLRSISELLLLLKGQGFVRIHRSYAVNLRRVREVRLQSDGAGWEVKLEPPVNRVLPVSRRELTRLNAVLDGD